MADKKYRLPNGNTTTNKDHYIKTWMELVKYIEADLDLRCTAIDPGATFVLKDKDGEATVTLPTWFIRKLSAACRRSLHAKKREALERLCEFAA